MLTVDEFATCIPTSAHTCTEGRKQAITLDGCETFRIRRVVHRKIFVWFTEIVFVRWKIFVLLKEFVFLGGPKSNRLNVSPEISTGNFQRSTLLVSTHWKSHSKYIAKIISCWSWKVSVDKLLPSGSCYQEPFSACCTFPHRQWTVHSVPIVWVWMTPGWTNHGCSSDTMFWSFPSTCTRY